MADDQQAMWGKLLSTMASIESHMSQARQAQARGDEAEAKKEGAYATARAGDIAEIQKKIETVKEDTESAVEASEKRLGYLKDQLDLMKEQKRLGVDIKEETLDGQKQAIKNEETLQKKRGKSSQLVKGILKTTLGITDVKMEDTALGQILDPTNWASLAEQVQENLTLSKVAASIYLKFIQATMAQIVALDQAQSSMQRSTALGADYNDMLADNGDALRSVGLGYAEAGQGITALQTNMSNFALLSRQSQADLSLLAAANEQLGVSADVSSRNMSTMMQVLGMTTQETINQSNELAALAINLGRPPQQVAEDFAAAAPQLAQFGSRMTGMFEELQIQATATGVSMQELLNIVERLDTFEGAADAAGRLNAVLGGGVLNSMDLLAAEGPEKIALLQQAFQQTGHSLSDLDQRTQRYVAGVLGVDVTQANRMLSGSIGEQTAALQALAAEEADLDDQRRQAASIQQKLTALMSAFGLAVGPLVEMITGILTPLSAWISENKTLFQVLMGGVVVMWAVRKAVLASRKAMIAINAAGSLMRAMYLLLIPAEVAQGTAATTVATTSGPAAAGLTAIGAAGQKAAPGLFVIAGAGFVLGLAILMIGGAVLMAAYGMSLLVDSFRDFAAAISIEKLMALSLLGLAAPGFLLAALAMGPLAVGIGMLSLALALLPEQKLVSLQGSFEAIDGAITAVAQAPDAPLKIMAVIDKASELADKQLELRTDVLSATADMITNTFGEFFGTGGQASQDVVLVLKDREFARAVNAVVQDNLQATVIRG
jgi:hypothetical protein